MCTCQYVGFRGGGMVFCQRHGGIEHLLQHFLTTLHMRGGREGCWCL